jgi:hypothetical protein
MVVVVEVASTQCFFDLTHPNNAHKKARMLADTSIRTLVSTTYLCRLVQQYTVLTFYDHSVNSSCLTK